MINVNKKSSKAAAVILFIIAVISLFSTLGIIAEMKDMAKYDNYYAWEIVGASSEKQEDGRFLITLDIKNTSSYQTQIRNNTINIEYGNGKRLENQMPVYPDGYLYDSLNYILIPAGQTVKHSLLIDPPQDVNTVRLTYFGHSYDRSKLLDENRDYLTYSVKLY
ncbi:MAG: hypothetical protein J6C96_08670 [Oscillospiraceae bacterium]|nr:hypothetical protein [Oscillospiraceae bacterium]